MHEPADDIFFSRDESRLGPSRRSLSRAASKGIARRIARGAYLSEIDWQNASPRGRYLSRVMAVALTRRSATVVSHWSAAAFYDLPRVGAWPRDVHLTVPESASSGSKNGIAKHRSRLLDDDIVDIGGIAVTSLSRTVLDVAATSPFRDAVTVTDAVLLIDRFGRRNPLTTREELESAWLRAQPMKAPARTRAVLAFAETGAESPIESVSRVTMRTIGVPRPELQTAHYDRYGLIGFSDFSCPGFARLARPTATRSISTRTIGVVAPQTRSFSMRNGGKIDCAPPRCRSRAGLGLLRCHPDCCANGWWLSDYQSAFRGSRAVTCAIRVDITRARGARRPERRRLWERMAE